MQSPRLCFSKKPTFNCYFVEPKEAVGISCEFNDDCACGYTYFSSNINDMWLRKRNDTKRKIPVFPLTTMNTADYTTNQSTTTVSPYSMEQGNVSSDVTEITNGTFIPKLTTVEPVSLTTAEPEYEYFFYTSMYQSNQD